MLNLYKNDNFQNPSDDLPRAKKRLLPKDLVQPSVRVKKLKLHSEQITISRQSKRGQNKSKVKLLL